MENNCVFCNIIQKKEPSVTILESHHTLALMDIYPATRGHILIIPKQHYETFEEMTNRSVLHDLIESLQRVSSTMIKANVCTDYSIVQSNGLLADQDIQHVHFHIIPRYENDFVHMDLHANAKKASLQELQALSQVIIREL
ncbi:HIT family protein [Longirhabdus pacifica]|uniref:HIT family protein n=1 Tax=Longirhabdus pacifica TaxID=2305227 RepID=UPI001009345E|nr:HIT family protein [Longirhabdus pacifica]